MSFKGKNNITMKYVSDERPSDPVPENSLLFNRLKFLTTFRQVTPHMLFET